MSMSFVSATNTIVRDFIHSIAVVRKAYVKHHFGKKRKNKEKKKPATTIIENCLFMLINRFVWQRFYRNEAS